MPEGQCKTEEGVTSPVLLVFCPSVALNPLLHKCIENIFPQFMVCLLIFQMVHIFYFNIDCHFDAVQFINFSSTLCALCPVQESFSFGKLYGPEVDVGGYDQRQNNSCV